MFDDFMQSLLQAEWLHNFVMLIMQVLMGITSIILLPISVLINVLLPDFDEALGNIDILFVYALQYWGWTASAFAIPGALISIGVGYLTFVITAKLSVFGIKFGMNVYKSIRRMF